jgi:hypothetical protein
MDDFEEALRNIDVFCKVLVRKMIGDENEAENKIVVEPIENLLQRKYVIEEHLESNPLAKHLIPLPQVEEPLIDIFEDDNYVKVLVQCRCKEQKVTVHTNMDGIQICKKECYRDDEGIEVCTDRCQKLDLPVKDLQVENMIAKCSNNTVLEVEIPKTKPQ